MAKYKIKYEYQTGNSFGSEDKEDILEFEWENLDIAKENLKRIKEHWLFYYEIEYGRRWRVGNKDRDLPQPPSWWKVTNDSGFSTSSFESTKHHIINLVLDNGNEVQFWPPWIGYFERLYGAEIITEESDMKFTI